MPAPKTAPPPDQIKRIELSRPMAAALRDGLTLSNSIAVEAEAVNQRLQTARAIHERYLKAVIQDGGYKWEEFQTYRILEVGGKEYLFAGDVQQPQPINLPAAVGA